MTWHIALHGAALRFHDLSELANRYFIQSPAKVVGRAITETNESNYRANAQANGRTKKRHRNRLTYARERQPRLRRLYFLPLGASKNLFAAREITIGFTLEISRFVLLNSNLLSIWATKKDRIRSCDIFRRNRVDIALYFIHTTEMFNASKSCNLVLSFISRDIRFALATFLNSDPWKMIDLGTRKGNS